jgi:hypothetical protein
MNPAVSLAFTIAIDNGDIAPFLIGWFAGWLFIFACAVLTT